MQKPAAKFFNVDEVRAHCDSNPSIISQIQLFIHGDNSVSFEGQKFVDGYLIKNWSVKSIEVEAVHPTFTELQKFQTKHVDGSGGRNPCESTIACVRDQTGDQIHEG